MESNLNKLYRERFDAGEISKRKLIKTGPLYAGDLSSKTLEKAYGFFKRVFGYQDI